MSKRIKEKYRKAGLKPPDGKGIHTEKFHSMAVGIKKANPSYPMERCYKIAMGQLGPAKAVNPSHRRKAGNPKKHHSGAAGSFIDKRSKL